MYSSGLELELRTSTPNEEGEYAAVSFTPISASAKSHRWRNESLSFDMALPGRPLRERIAGKDNSIASCSASVAEEFGDDMVVRPLRFPAGIRVGKR